MCVKNISKQFYIVMNFPKHFHKQPSVVGVVKQNPVYRQIFEDTKNFELHFVHLELLGIKPIPGSSMRMFALDIPLEKLF